MKKFIILGITGLLAILSFNSFKAPKSNPDPPSGYTGAPSQNRTCRNCHGDFALNTAGGSVVATGLPTGSYVAGQVYNFTVKITNATPKQIWGFAIKAVVAGTGTALGTFSTTNPNATVASNELKNTNAATLNGTSYTYTNLRWTAPASGTSVVSFYMTGLAGDNDNSEAGDFVYSNSIISLPLPVALGDITGKLYGNSAIIEWNTFSESGSAYFELERSVDGRNYEVIKMEQGAGASNTVKYYNYTDNNIPVNKQVLYYRLKMIEQNGKFEYSKVITLKPSVTTYIENVYPSLTTLNEMVRVKMISHTEQQAQIIVYSSLGQKMSEQVYKLAKGENIILLNNFSQSGRGVYLVNIKAGGFTDTRKVIVQ